MNETEFEADGRDLRRLAATALMLALVAPEKPASFAQSMLVPVSAINELRAELERLGVDWRSAHRTVRRLQREKERAAIERARTPELGA